MKIKTKDMMDKIKLTVNHKELYLIELALNNFKLEDWDFKILNEYLFDKHEFKDNHDKIKKIRYLENKIKKVLDKINVY